MQIKHKLFRR